MQVTGQSPGFRASLLFSTHARVEVLHKEVMEHICKAMQKWKMLSHNGKHVELRLRDRVSQ